MATNRVSNNKPSTSRGSSSKKPPAVSTKTERINSELKRQLSAIISQELKDPRVTGMVSIIKVDCDRDLKTCKVYLSVLGAEGKELEVVKAINKAEGFIKYSLKSKVDMRALPELRFILDDSITYGIKISKILHDIGDIPPAEIEETEE